MRIHSMQAHVHLLTGDNWATAQSCVERIGVPHVLAGVRPEGKAHVIEELQDVHQTVAMVGADINGAPALAAANLAALVRKSRSRSPFSFPCLLTTSFRGRDYSDIYVEFHSL
jgi:cation transport ATPase